MNFDISKCSSNTRLTILTLAFFLIAIWSLAFYASHVLREDIQPFVAVESIQQEFWLAALLLTLLAVGLAWWFITVQRVKESLVDQVAERVEELKRKNDFEQFRSDVLGLVGGDESVSKILEAIVRGVEQLHPGMICSILLLDREGKHLGNGVSVSLPEFYTAAINGIEIGMGVGSCGTAAFTGERVIVDDIATHPYWVPYTDLTTRAGLGACWSQPILSSSGQVLGTFAIYHHEKCSPAESEITLIEQSAKLASIAIDKNIATETLQASEQRFRSFVENVNDVLFSLTPSGKFLYVSPQWKTAFGYEISETIGQPFHPFVHPDDVSSCVEFTQNILDTGEKNSGVEFRMRCKDGTYLWYRTRATALKDIVTGRSSIVGIARDITERKEEEERLRQFNELLDMRVFERTTALKKSEKMISQLLQSTDQGIYGTDETGRFTFINRAGLHILGYQIEDLLGTDSHDLIHHSHADGTVYPREECPVYRAKSLMVSSEGDNEIFWRHDGTSFPVQFSSYPVIENGSISAVVVTFSDITERKKLREQLLQSQKMEAVGQLAGGLAHDFNNVLSIINGYCCLLEMGVGHDDAQKEYLGKILAASNRAGELTHSMLAFSRTQVMNPQSQNLNGIIAKVGCLVEKIIGENIQFNIVVKKAVLPVFVDGCQIEQLLINLCNNARDAMPNGGELAIVTDNITIDTSFVASHSFGTPGRYAVITVSDSGTGMDEATRKKIFEPFFTTKAVDKGTGLGLAMVYGITKQHNGFVDVDSEPGHGACFRIYLPIVENETALNNVKAIEDGQASAGSETILIAEDCADIRGFMNEALTLHGYQVICAVDGQDAVEKFKENADKIQLIIMDMIMPHKSGKAAYDEIKQIRPEAKALFSSGYSANIVQQQGELGKNAEFMSKPLQPALLLKKVREMLDR